jgi:hypothetical protein
MNILLDILLATNKMSNKILHILASIFNITLILGIQISNVSSFTIWSNDFHISPIDNIKQVLRPLNVTFIDKSLSGHCHLTLTCATNLRVLDRHNGITPTTETKHNFYDTYKDDPEMGTVDAYACFHPSAMCELFMPFNNRIFVVATTRYEMGRETVDAWTQWNQNLQTIASCSHNLVAANNLYDAKYIEYFTGLHVQVFGSFIPPVARYNPSSGTNDILVAAMHTPFEDIIFENMKLVIPDKWAYQLHKLRSKYSHYTYNDLCSNVAIIHIPYQVSVMSLFEQYAMGIPLLIPTPEFLWGLHNQWGVVSERTWDQVHTQSRPSGSIIPRHSTTSVTIPDPNNDVSREAFLYWVAYADFYQWNHIIYFDSWPDLILKIDTTDWTRVSSLMLQYAKTQLTQVEQQWTEVIDNNLSS